MGTYRTIVTIVPILIDFHQCNLNWAKLCTKLKWENIQHCPSSECNDTLKKKKNDLWGLREAATYKKITPLLSTPGAVTQSRGTWLKRARPWFFFPLTQSHNLSQADSLHDILYHSAQGKDMFLAQAQMQHPEVWPCSPAQSSSNLPPETPDGWTWYLVWNLRLSMVSQLGSF